MKKITFLVFLSVSTLFVKSQEGVDGLNYNLEGLGTLSFNSNPYGTIPFYGVGLYPRLNLYTPADHFSIAIGSPSNIGIDLIAGSAGTQVSFFTDVPIELSMNLGDRATKEAQYILGGHAGVGVDYNYAYFTNSFTNTVINLHSFGPMASVGFRWRYYGRPLGVRFSVMYGVFNNYKEDPTIINDQDIIPTVYNLSMVYGMQ